MDSYSSVTITPMGPLECRMREPYKGANGELVLTVNSIAFYAKAEQFAQIADCINAYLASLAPPVEPEKPAVAVLDDWDGDEEADALRG